MNNPVKPSCPHFSNHTKNTNSTGVNALIGDAFTLVSIPYGQKRPLNKGWNRRENVVGSLDQVGQLAGMNIGLAHAYCTPSPTCAIDCDDVAEATIWLADHGIDLVALQNAPDAVGIISGKPNSSKLMFRLPEGLPALTSKALTGPTGRMILEFRCATKSGLTVQDILPPSLHPSGTQYQWVGCGSILNLPLLPTSLLELWLDLIKLHDRPREAGLVAVATPETNRQVAMLKHKLGFIEADCDYETYRNVIWGIASTGWNCAYNLALEWSLTAEHRFEEHMLDALFYSYDPDRNDRITLGTIYHYAQKGGWHD